jgi:large subunit ribosomal protein L10Ae
LILNLFRPFDQLIASESLIKQIPKLLGNTLNKINKFPIVLGESEGVSDKVAEVRSTVKYQLKKVLCMGTAVGTVSMNEEEIR